MPSEYQLKEEVWRKINTPAARRKLMDALGVTEFTIARYIQKKNKKLTAYGALVAISELTGLPITEIIEKKSDRVN